MKKFLNYIAFILNILASAGLLFAYLATHISPGVFWPLAFFGLIFPYLLIINILFLFYWVILWSRRMFLPLLVILLGINHIYHSIPVIRLTRPDLKQEGKDIKILSYNVRAFNLYDWLNDPNTNKGILNFIRSEHPDIICLQEFYSGKGLNRSAVNYLRLFGENPYRHIEYADPDARSGLGIATFSKYPIIKKGLIPFNNSSNMSVYTDILVNGDTVRIYNNHLQSVRFRENNYRMIDSLTMGGNPPEMREIRDISSKLKNAFIQRARQTDLVKAHAAESPHPVIICGDFNDTPVSYTYKKMSRGLDDAFLEAGKGRGNTYLGKLSLRIDYILYSPVFSAVEFEKVEANLSDHYPIITILRK